MKFQPSRTPALCNRSWLAILGIGAAIGVLLLNTPVAAQSSPQSDSDADSAENASVDPETEVESAPGRCSCCQHGTRQGRGKSPGQGKGAGQGKGRGQKGQGGGGLQHGSGRPDARIAHFLVENHSKLDRTIEIIPGGVRTQTVSSDPEIVDALRTHVRQMAELIEDGGRIRNWDPLFREIFDHREAITMKIVDIDRGVEVVETSSDDEVAQLIRAHAGKVADFVTRGIEAYQEETPLPEPISDPSP